MYQLEVIFRAIREAIYDAEHRDESPQQQETYPMPTLIRTDATPEELRTTIDLAWKGRPSLAAKWFGVSSRQVQRWLYREVPIDTRTAIAMWVKRRELEGEIFVFQSAAPTQPGEERGVTTDVG